LDVPQPMHSTDKEIEVTTPNPMTKAPLIPVSWGEVFDKITILEIKASRLSGPDALANVRKELQLLKTCSDFDKTSELTALISELKAVNLRLWDIEDLIREEERKGEFGESFISLARSVYRENDKRAALKREINTLLYSELVEEKSYADYA
jgi:hypothetical protein